MPGRPATFSSSGYQDGLGRRTLVFDRAEGATCERLILRPELGVYAAHLRERAERLTRVESDRLAHPRRIERDGPAGLLHVETPFPNGQRLSDLLAAAEDDPELAIGGVDLAIGFLLDVFPVLDALHRQAGFAHGTLAPGRLLLTPDGQIILLDAVYADVLARLGWSRARFWRELGVAVPATHGPLRFSPATDVLNAVIVALVLMLGRPLRERDYPAGLAAIQSEAVEIAEIRGGGEFAIEFGHFLDRALDPSSPEGFIGARQAAHALYEIAESAMGSRACRDALRTVAENAAEAAYVPPPAPRPKPPASAAPAPKPRPSAPLPPPMELRIEIPSIPPAPPVVTPAPPAPAPKPAPARVEKPGPKIEPPPAPPPALEPIPAFEPVKARVPEPPATIEPEPVRVPEPALKAEVAPTPAPAPAPRVEPEPERVPEPVAKVEPKPEPVPEPVARVEAVPVPEPVREPVAAAPPPPAPVQAAPPAPPAPPAPDPPAPVVSAPAPVPVATSAPEPVPVAPPAPTPVVPVPAPPAAPAPQAKPEPAKPADLMPPGPPAPAPVPAPVQAAPPPPPPTQAPAEPVAAAPPSAPVAESARKKKRGRKGRADSLRSKAEAKAAKKAEKAPLVSVPPVVPPPAPPAPPQPVFPATAYGAPSALTQPSYGTPPAAPAYAPAPVQSPYGSPSPPPPVRPTPAAMPSYERVPQGPGVYGGGSYAVPMPQAEPGQIPMATIALKPGGGIQVKKTEPPPRPVTRTPPPDPHDFPSPRFELREEPSAGINLKVIAAVIVLVALGLAGARQYLWHTPSESLDPAPEETPVAATSTRGSLILTSTPPGARVLIDGQPVGQTPLTLDDVIPGRRVVTFVAEQGTVRRTVRVEAGRSAEVDVTVFSGWLTVDAPLLLEVVMDGRVVGTTEQPRVMLPPGRHTLTLRNQNLNYRATQIVNIEPGEESRLNLSPTTPINLNATPWAEVWIDGKRIGETPVANVPVQLGTREIIFRHPELGERRLTPTIKAGSPDAISVDMARSDR